MLELDINGNQVAKNIRGLSLVKRTITGKQLYYFYNAHGDVTTLLSGNGAVSGKYYYDAFGNITEQTGSVDNPIRYAGYQYDEETGIYYLNARYYDPKIARFLTEDTYKGRMDDPLSLNLYTYVSNNPIMYIDPTGHAAANVTIGDVSVGNAQINNGTTTGNLTDIAKGLGLDKPTYDSKTNTTTMELNGLKVTFDCSKTQGVASDGTPYSVVNGKIQVGVRDMAKKAGVEDTISWWSDNKKQTNVVVQPDMKDSSVKVTRTGDKININAYVNFTGDAKELFPGTQKTYADVVIEGITGKWDNLSFNGTNYDFGQGKTITVNTTVHHTFNQSKVGTQNYFEINIDNDEAGIWGIRNIGKLDIDKQVSHMDGGADNWSISGKKKITMYKDYNGGSDYSESDYKNTVAHEFGHILGLGDAYAGGSRPAAKVTKEVPDNPGFYTGDIMRDNGYVTANDIEMVWEAWSTNSWQYFQTYDGHNRSNVIRIK